MIRADVPTGTVVSVNSGKCVDIPGSDFSDEVALQQHTCNGGLNQMFTINAV